MRQRYSRGIFDIRRPTQQWIGVIGRVAILPISKILIFFEGLATCGRARGQQQRLNLLLELSWPILAHIRCLSANILPHKIHLDAKITQDNPTCGQEPLTIPSKSLQPDSPSPKNVAKALFFERRIRKALVR